MIHIPHNKTTHRWMTEILSQQFFDNWISIVNTQQTRLYSTEVLKTIYGFDNFFKHIKPTIIFIFQTAFHPTKVNVLIKNIYIELLTNKTFHFHSNFNSNTLENIHKYFIIVSSFFFKTILWRHNMKSFDQTPFTYS